MYIFLITCKGKKCVFADFRKFQTRKSQKRLGPKIRLGLHLRKVRKSNKLSQSANLLFAEVRPPLLIIHRKFLHILSCVQDQF